MTDTAAPTAPAPTRGILVPVLVAAGFTLLGAVPLYLATGTTLGLFFGGIALVTLVLPPMSLQRTSWMDQAFIASAVNDSVGLVWLAAALFTPHVSLGQWLLCYLVLAAYSFALWGWTRAARAVGLPPILASASGVVVAGLWLTWPIWLARLDLRSVAWLVDPHPLLSMNGVLKHLGIWAERPIAYNHLLNLGQDVAYTLPNSVLAAVFIHLIVGGICFAVSAARGGHSPQDRGGADAHFG